MSDHIKITLPCGRVALIDEADRAKIANTSLTYKAGRYGHGAVQGWDRIAKVNVSLHRLIMDAPSGLEVDHINHDVLDNRRANLRLCNRAENSRNRRYRKASPYPKGVYGRPGYPTCRAGIHIDGAFVTLGSFDSPIKAAVAYDLAAKKHFGEFALLNFSPDRDWILPDPTPTKKTIAHRRGATR